MKKLLLLLLFISGTILAQKKAPAQTSNALTTADANSFVIYVNSTNEFLRGNIYKLRDVYDDVIASKSYVRGCEIFLDPKLISNRMIEFKINEIPAKLNIKTKTELKELFVVYENDYKNAIEWYKNQVLTLCKDDCNLKSTTTDEVFQKSVENQRRLIEKFVESQEKFYNLVEQIGDQAEQIILAKHPFKNEITDMRKTIRLISNVNNTILVQDEETIIKENIEKSKTNIEEVISINQKYVDYETNPANKNKNKDLKEIVTKFFGKSSKNYIIGFDDYSKCVAQVCNKFKRYDNRTNLEQLLVDLKSKLDDFINVNNR